MNNYWNQTGKNQKDFDRLLELMPAKGKCDTVAGELVRAANKLGYDYWNNGMGNNTSGAINYLDHIGVFDMDRTNLFGKIYEYTRGKIPSHNDFEGYINDMIDMTIEYILAHPELETQPNEADMLDFSDPEQHFCDECGEETDRGWECEDCEDARLDREMEEEEDGYYY